MYEIRENDYALKPRERLLVMGAEKLNEQELLAILLRTGTKKEPVYRLSERILEQFENLSNFRNASVAELEAISGIGKVKAIELKAMIELGKRIHAAGKQYYGKVLGSEAFGQQMMDEMSNFEQEHLLAVYLDTRNRVIQKKTIFIGTVNSAPAVPREILHHAVKLMATSLIVVHNHPSGNPNPSDADFDFTKSLRKSCLALGVVFTDHLIVGKGKYFSFRERELLG